MSYGCWASSTQVCASCKYWLGRRDVDFCQTTFEALDDTGKCINQSSGFNQMKTNMASACGNWKKVE